MNGEELIGELRDEVRTHIGAFAAPTRFLLRRPPKTSSGKIMRRILRKIAANQVSDLGDISTLADPSVVEKLVELRAKLEKTGEIKA